MTNPTHPIRFTSSPGRPGVPCVRCGGHGFLVYGPCFLCNTRRVAPAPRTPEEVAIDGKLMANDRGRDFLRRDRRKETGMTHAQRRECMAALAVLDVICYGR